MISYAAVNGITTKYYDDGDDVILEKTGSSSIYYVHGPKKLYYLF